MGPKQRSISVERTALYTFWLAVIVVVGAALRLFLLTNQSLWFDEGTTLVLTDSKSIHETYTALWTIAGGDKYQPLYFLILAFWRGIFGDSEFALRLFSVIPGIVSILCIYFFVAKVCNRRHAVYSALFVACSSFCVVYSQEVRPYSLLLCLAALQLLFFGSALTDKKPTLHHRLLFAGTTVLCCAGSIILMVFTIALSIAHIATTRKIRLWISWWLPTVVSIVPMILYFMSTPAASSVSSDSTNGLGVPLYLNAVFSLYGHLAGQSYGPPLDTLRGSENLSFVIGSYFPQLAALLLVICSLTISSVLAFARQLRQPQERDNTIFFILLFGFSFLLAAILAAATKINWMPRHSIYLTLPIAVLLPMCFVTTNRTVDTGRRQRQLGAAAFFSLISINLYANYNYFYKSEYWRDDYRSAAAFLSDKLSNSDRSFLLWGETRLLAYYGDQKTHDAWRKGHQPLVNGVNDVEGKQASVYVGINREFTWTRQTHSENGLQELLDNGYQLVPVANFVNFNIYKVQVEQFAIIDE